jgi:large subunit ribosomal protein L27
MMLKTAMFHSALCRSKPLSQSAFNLQTWRFATKKAGGSSRNGRDSPGKRLGLKKSGGEPVIPGNIIIRQRGLTYGSGENTKVGRDYTIYAVAKGWVVFKYDREKRKQIVHVSAVNPNLRHQKKVELSVSEGGEGGGQEVLEVLV